MFRGCLLLFQKWGKFSPALKFWWVKLTWWILYILNKDQNLTPLVYPLLSRLCFLDFWLLLSRIASYLQVHHEHLDTTYVSESVEKIDLLVTQPYLFILLIPSPNDLVFLIVTFKPILADWTPKASTSSLVFLTISSKILKSGCFQVFCRLIQNCSFMRKENTFKKWILIQQFVVTNCSKERPGSIVNETLKNGFWC